MTRSATRTTTTRARPEVYENCHRSESAEAYIGGGINGKNFTCSGAETSTFYDSSDFKPGLDFYINGFDKGQARRLQA